MSSYMKNWSALVGSSCRSAVEGSGWVAAVRAELTCVPYLGHERKDRPHACATLLRVGGKGSPDRHVLVGVLDRALAVDDDRFGRGGALKVGIRDRHVLDVEEAKDKHDRHHGKGDEAALLAAAPLLLLGFDHFAARGLCAWNGPFIAHARTAHRHRVAEALCAHLVRRPPLVHPKLLFPA
eukprot:3195677-Prymnesium_polylepis.1